MFLLLVNYLLRVQDFGRYILQDAWWLNHEKLLKSELDTKLIQKHRKNSECCPYLPLDSQSLILNVKIRISQLVKLLVGHVTY